MIWKIFLTLLVGPRFGLHADDKLGLQRAFDRSEIVVVGWTHLAVNHVVTDAIREQLRSLVPREMILALEVTEEDLRRGKFGASGIIGLQLFSSAKSYGFTVIGIDDHQLRGRESNEDLDAHISRRLAEHARSGQKILLLIGSRHLNPIVSHLRRMGFKVDAVPTEYDFESGAVTLHGHSLGISGVDFEYKAYAEMLRGYEKMLKYLPYDDSREASESCAERFGDAPQ